MGYGIVLAKSTLQLQRLIRTTAKDSGLVVVTEHAAGQMRKRRITRLEVDFCLKSGCLHRQPEPNLAKGSLECRMEAYVSGRNLAVIVALTDEDPSLVVVTAMKVS